MFTSVVASIPVRLANDFRAGHERMPASIR